MVYTAGSLFSGIGGIDYAFASAGFDIRFQVEIDPYCRKVLQKHAPTYWRNAVIHEDVTHVGKHNVPSVDVLFGGFPCQDLSNAGKRAGIKDGTRSGLWYEFSRIISDLRPRAILLENVAGIYTLGGTTVLGNLAEIGYDAIWFSLYAADIGSPQLRERWFALGYPQSIGDQRNGRTVGCSPSETGKQDDGRVAQCYGQDVLRFRGKGISQPRMGRAINGLPGQLDEHRFPARRGHKQLPNESPRTTPTQNKQEKQRIHALGNAVVPQVIYPLALAINAWLTQIDTAQAASSEVAA